MTASGAGEDVATGLPLRGRRIAVTRPAAEEDEFVAALERFGAEVLVAPLILIERPPDPVALRVAALDAESYDWLVFTSANAVDQFQAARVEAGVGAWPAGDVLVCTVGPGTAAAVQRAGGKVDAMPASHVGEAVVGAIAGRGPPRGARILFPRAAGARPVVADSLRQAGAMVDEVIAYRTVQDAAGVPELGLRLARGEVDVLTFTSGSAVRSFVAALGVDTGRAQVACIGPITGAVAREIGLEVAIEAEDYTTEGLAAAIVRHLKGGTHSGRE